MEQPFQERIPVRFMHNSRSLTLKTETKGSWHSGDGFLVDVQPWRWTTDPSNERLATAACLVDPPGVPRVSALRVRPSGGPPGGAASNGASSRSTGLLLHGAVSR